jgi:AraC-like DNA-binding protein
MKQSNPSTAPLIRLAHPLAFAAFLRKVGTPVDRLFSKAGLPVYYDDPGVFVPLRNSWAWFDAGARLEDPGLGWHVGQFVGDKRLSAGMLKRLEHAPTLYQALFALVRLVRSESSQLHIGISEGHDSILVYTRYPMKDWPGYTSSQAYQLAVYIDLIRHYLGRSWMPEEIGIESPIAPRVIHEHYPDCRVLAGQQFGYISVPRSRLHSAPIGIYSKNVESSPLVRAGNFDNVDAARAVIQAYLADGYPSARKTANLLDTSERSLFRMLADRGVSYQTLVDEVRFDAAKKLLRDQELPQSEIASCLGFTDPANFSRMFRRIGGLSPREFRKAIQTSPRQ